MPPARFAPDPSSRRAPLDPAALLDAVSALPRRKPKDGSGRAAADLALSFGVSEGFIYLTRKILNQAPDSLIGDIRAGRISISQAGRIINKALKDTNASAPEPPHDAVSDSLQDVTEEFTPLETPVLEILKNDSGDQRPIALIVPEAFQSEIPEEKAS